MHGYAAIIAQQAIDQLHEDARQARLARAASAHGPRRSIVARTAGWLRRKLEEPVSDTFMVTPKLTDYPYRS